MYPSTLPSILNQYLAENLDECIVSNSVENADSVEKKKSTQEIRTEQRIARNDTLLFSDEQRRTKLKKEELQRHEQVTENWEQVKAEVQQERHEQLQEKLVLQKRLIRAQDKRSEIIRCHQQQRQAKKRANSKEGKKKKEQALKEKGSKPHKKTSTVNKNEETTATAVNNAETSAVKDQEARGNRESSNPDGDEQSHAHCHGGYFPSLDFRPAQSPMTERSEEEEYSETVEPFRTSDVSQLPWYQQQLYLLYGQSADDFINPKLKQETVEVVNPRLQGQKGYMGAGHLWNKLRGDSKSKLYSKDDRFPQDLKNAFSSHVREGLSTNRQPVFRNFTQTDDVPDLNRLLDQSYLKHVRGLRHKTELMYRSSQTNEDRTRVLLFNNPLPDIQAGDDRLTRFLLPRDYAASELTEASYMRWLTDDECKHQKGEVGTKEYSPPRQPLPPSVLSPIGSDYSQSLQNIWMSIMERQRPRKEPRYHFLTERECTSPGQFLQKLGLDKDKTDMGRTDLLPRLSLPSLHSAPSRQSRHRLSDSYAEAEDKSKYLSNWEPLTLKALEEYKQQRSTVGEGQFKHGQMTMWPVSVANGQT